MSCFYSFNKILVFSFGHGINKVYAGLINCQNISRSKDSNVGSNNRHCLYTFAVAGNAHVPHDINISYVLAKIVNGGLGGLSYLLHEFLFVHSPVVAVLSMDPHFAHTTVSAANTDVLVAATKTAHGVSLEMRKNKH